MSEEQIFNGLRCCLKKVDIATPCSGKVLPQSPLERSDFQAPEESSQVRLSQASQQPQLALLLCDHNSETKVVGARDPEALSKERAGKERTKSEGDQACMAWTFV